MWNEDRDICFLCGEKGQWAKKIAKETDKADGTEAGMEEREEPATLNRGRDIKRVNAPHKHKYLL